MNNKKLLSIITLVGIAGMNMQPIAQNTAQSKNTILLANKNISSNIQEKINSNIHNIKDNVITINNVWNQNIGSLKFNPLTNKIELVNGWAETNPYAPKTETLFSISLYKSSGELIKSVQVKPDEQLQQNLYNVFNNLEYTYGDILEINYKISSKISISNFDNQKSYQVTKPIIMKITKGGLENYNISHIKVNPFDVLGNGKVTTGIISGKTNKPNQNINVIVNGKTFSGKSNSNGDFNISISDNSGFIASTNIIVETSGELATIINPTADTNLGILKSNITISDKDQDGTFGQMITFNPSNMTVNNHGSNFAAQLISGKTGQVLASCSTSNFNVFSSKNDLNGAHFEYGDIIAVYEPQETELSMGELLLDSGKSKIDCTNKFKCFKITPNGLVPVANNNLTTSQILYKGTNNMSLTGKTLPNTDVTVTYGNVSKVVKSNSEGDFSLEIPVSEAPINSEVRIFVNNDNAEILTVQYDTKLININSNRIQVVNNTNVPIFNITFDAVNNKLKAIEYPLAKQYTGAFYSNTLNIRLIDPKNGDIIYSFTGDKLNDISSFISQINNKSYTLGDIIEVSYNPDLVKANVYDGKKMIGNTDGSNEYFEITNERLVNLNNKFINVKPLDILSNIKVTSTNIEGTAKPNTSVEVSVDGNVFKGMTNGNGDFNIAINDKGGFTSNTNIVVSSEGYIPTHINPAIQSNIELQNSYINFYNGEGRYGQISSSITFNPETMKFVVDNYADSFGNGKSHYFNFDLYSSNGEKLFNTSINNGATSAVTEAINDKSFNYGDIIGLSYNNTISKPAILNGNTVLGNISGEEEYFRITKEGLVKVNFGQSAYTSNVSWDNNNLVIDSNLADGQNENILNANKKLVILNSDNQVVDSVNTSTLDNNSSSVQGIILESALDKLNKGETYTFALDINNKLFPIKVASNTSSNSSYLLEGNSNNILLIAIAEKPVVTINNSNEIVSYFNTLNSNISSIINSNSNVNILTNNELNYKVIAREFISRIGVNNLEDLYNKSEANKEFVNWVLNNKIAMQDYLEGTNPTGVNVKALQIWSDIWNKYTNSRSGFNLKLAIATAVSNANPIMAWPSTHYYGYGDTVTVGSPVERYNIFETLNAEGGMLPIFKTLDVKHIEYVVSTCIANSQIIELRNIIIQNHNGYINSSTTNGLNHIDYTIQYNEINPHTGQSVDANSDFYGPHPNVADVWYDGGVCFSIAELGAAACQVFGVPAQPETQDNGVHKVFIFYNNDHEWNIGNNIFGLSKTFGGDISGWSNGIATGPNTANYNWLYEKADTPALKKSNEYLWLASSISSYQDKVNAINEAIKIQPLNLRAWLDKIALMKTNHNLTVQDYIKLNDQIINTFKDYPMPMFDTILQIRDIILAKGTSQDYNTYIKAIENALNSVTNSEQEPIAQNMLKLMPEEGLGSGVSILSTSKITINNVWNQSLAVLGFNTLSMKMNVNKGWSVINPYLKERAFTIGLYNKNNELIKSVTLKGGDHPENPLYNAFNNLEFKYGDKIFIDYKTSSKISVNNYAKAGVVSSSYDVNKPSVFEITKDGLVYLGDSLKNSVPPTGVVNVNTVYENGKQVEGSKYNYTEKGNIYTLIQNESMPLLTGYEIDYVTVNAIKTSLDKLPKYYINGTIDIVYHLKTIEKQGSKDNNKNNMKSNSEDIYWDNNSLVINGNINLDNKVLSKNTPKEIIIKDSKGNIVASNNTIAVNWYSKDKNNYSGYQGIFTNNQLSKLKPNESYKVYIKIDGIEIPIKNNIISRSNKTYIVDVNKDGNLIITRNVIKQTLENVGTYETGYFTNFGYVLNGNINLNNDIFNKKDSRMLVIKDTNGNVIDKVNCASMNWYSSNKENYSGFQGIIPNSILDKLKPGEEYNFELEVNYNGKIYNLPIDNTNNIILNTEVNYNIATNSKNNLVISPNLKDSNVEYIHGSLGDGYWEPYGYVMNIKVNIGKKIPKGTKMQLISKNSNGQVVSVTKGVDVNWYSNDRSDYNGFQAIITPGQLINISINNKLYTRISLDGKVYETPIKGNINIPIGNLGFGFKTMNNQVYLIKK